MDYEFKYKVLMSILKEADTAGLFDLNTSRNSSIPDKHRKAIRQELTDFERYVAPTEDTYYQTPRAGLT